MFGISKIQICLMMSGMVGLIVSVVMGFGGMDFLQRLVTTRLFRLIPDTFIWDVWENIPVDMYQNIYMFNITNAEKLSEGEKPVLKEIGPYVYRVKLNKVDITTNDVDDSVKYRQLKTYYFIPEMSAGSDSDLITYINIMFLAVAHRANNLTKSDIVLETIDEMLSSKGEKLYRTSTLKEIMHDGTNVEAYVDLLNDPLSQSKGHIPVPHSMADGKFALLKGKNGTDEGEWVVHSGIRASDDFVRIISVDNKTQVDTWNGETCNTINGTDASFYQPLVEPGITKLEFFIPTLCRSLEWKFAASVSSEGIKCARFHMEDFLTPTENPDQACFCVESDLKKCNTTGLLLVTPCFDGAPAILSKPHFYKVDKSVLENVEGLHPNEENHESMIDLNPLTGLVVRARVRIMMSIELINYPGMPTFKNVHRAIVPLSWMEQEVTMDGIYLMVLSAVDILNSVWWVGRFLWMLGSLGMIGLSAFLFLRNRQNNAVTEVENGVSVFGNENHKEKEFIFVFTKNALRPQD